MEPNYVCLAFLPPCAAAQEGPSGPGAHSSWGRAGLQGVPARRGCFVLCSLSNFVLQILVLMKNFHAK